MPWYRDLSAVTVVADGPHVRAVGWLSSDHAFPTGSVAPEVMTRLKDFCARWSQGIESLVWPVAGGGHCCEFCGRCMTTGNIGVPAGPILYVAPEMIAHYVELHAYAPPPEFISALMASPLPGSPEYHDAVSSFREYAILRHKQTPIWQGD